MSATARPRPRIVLVGGGHAHALVLDRWRRHAPANARLTLVTSTARSPYSGMVPGWLAGRYPYEALTIDMMALAARAGAQALQDTLVAVDPDRRTLRLASGQSIDYDLLSLNVGSTLTPPTMPPSAEVLALRPLAALRDALDARWTAWTRRPPRRIRLSAVGAGPAGVEALLALVARCRAAFPDVPLQATLYGAATVVLPGLSPAARRLAARALQRAGVRCMLGRPWTPDAHAATAGADRGDAHLVLWATGAQPHAWQRDTRSRGTLAADEHGYLRVDDSLRSISHDNVFAAGDCAAFAPALPKSGVYAVRMGPHLARNLETALSGKPLTRYVPQRRSLVLLSTGDGRAVAARGAWAASGRWAGWWKDRLDRAFVDRFR